MQITLLRHGQPDISTDKALRAKELGAWIKAYNAANLIAEHKPPKKTIAAVHACSTIVCSDLNRSIESANMLGVTKIDVTDSLFRELELPHGQFLSPKLPLKVWFVLFRVLWFLGYSNNSESFKYAKLRAVSAAKKLAEMAASHDSVVFIGHGFLNRFIARALLANGWCGPVDPGKNFWQFGVYNYAT